MSTYLIGFIVCEYALVTYSFMDWNSKHPDKKMPVIEQIVGTLLLTAISLVWPIALAVWMRDLKGKL